MTALDGVNGTVCNAQQYQQSLQSHDSRSPWISCLTRGESIGVIVSIYKQLICPTLNSFNLQLAAEASSISCICVIVIFILIGVRPTSIHVYVLLARCCTAERTLVQEDVPKR